MADRKKFEEMLERLINEDKAGAEELFHEIVVEKSREIYENLLEDDLEDKDVDEASDEEVDESDDEEVDEASDEEVDESDDEQVDEDFNLDEFEVEADPMAAMGGDPADDMMGDVEVDGGDMGMDDMGGDDMGMDDMGSDDMGMDLEKEGYAFEANDEDDEDLEESLMREYVEKVAAPKMGDNGANTKSVVAKPNRMGGTSANIAKSFSTEKGGTQGGLLNPSTKEENFGNINVPGGKAGKSAFKKSEPGHGPEKKGKPEQADNKKSIVGSR
jgi:hypothetical protein